MANLSTHFMLDELTRTSTGLPNNPSDAEVLKLTNLCVLLLEPIRNHWGALRINSGFRSPAVNAANGGVITSQHVLAEAADFKPLHADIDVVFDWIVNESELDFGQCINEYHDGAHWIHISMPRLNGKNKEALIYSNGVYAPYAL